MNFQHFLEMLEIMLQHFRNILEIHCIKNSGGPYSNQIHYSMHAQMHHCNDVIDWKYFIM